MSLRALVDGVFDEALMTVDPAGNVISWNTGAERIFGYSGRADDRSALFGAVPTRMAARADRSRGGHPRNGAPPRDVAGPARMDDASGPAWRLLPCMAITVSCAVSSRSLATSPSRPSSDAEPCTSPLVRALADCADVDAAAETILTMTTLGLGATFSEMFVARQEEGRLDSTMRHAFPRSTLDALDVAADGAPGPVDALIARVRTTGTVVTVSDLNELGTSAQVLAAVSLGVRSAIACPITTAHRHRRACLRTSSRRCRASRRCTVESIAEISAEAAQADRAYSCPGRAARRSAPHGGARKH